MRNSQEWDKTVGKLAAVQNTDGGGGTMMGWLVATTVASSCARVAQAGFGSAAEVLMGLFLGPSFWFADDRIRRRAKINVNSA